MQNSKYPANLVNTPFQEKIGGNLIRRPRRILHIVGQIAGGGVGVWLLNLLRHIDRRRIAMDFIVYDAEPPEVEDEIRSLQGKLIRCPNPQKIAKFVSHIKRVLRESGPYDVVHSHPHHLSGLILRLSHQEGVPIRIAHSHVASSEFGSLFQNKNVQFKFLRSIYMHLMKRWIERYATLGYGASRMAAADLFGPDWQKDPRWRVLYCGVDLSRFDLEVNRQAIRVELGIPKDALVVGHVGRFVEEKNHEFLVQVATELAHRHPSVWFLLVGDGPLRPAIEAQVKKAGLEDRVIFTGLRLDVPRLMLGAMDIFFFPSRFEGLGLVLVEAQAAGLRCIFSDVIPGEADVVPELVRRLSLNQPISAWTEAVLKAGEGPLDLPRAQALARVNQSLFNLAGGLKELERVYAEG